MRRVTVVLGIVAMWWGPLRGTAAEASERSDPGASSGIRVMVRVDVTTMLDDLLARAGELSVRPRDGRGPGGVTGPASSPPCPSRRRLAPSARRRKRRRRPETAAGPQCPTPWRPWVHSSSRWALS
jgi:hypothetical protein